MAAARFASRICSLRSSSHGGVSVVGGAAVCVVGGTDVSIVGTHGLDMVLLLLGVNRQRSCQARTRGPRSSRRPPRRLRHALSWAWPGSVGASGRDIHGPRVRSCRTFGHLPPAAPCELLEGRREALPPPSTDRGARPG